MNPLVTVLMPVYNGKKYLKEAIESVLNQTFRDFEFLIIDDGSTDKSAEIIKSFNDARIRLERNVTNLGLIKTLNNGLTLSRGKYIARMDCDDISLPKRLSVQVNFMEKHPEIGICGSWVKVMGLKQEFVNRYPQKHEETRAYLLLNYRMHPESVSKKNSSEQTENSDKVRLGLIKNLGLAPTPVELDLHRRFIRPDYLNPKDFIDQLETWLGKLLSANEEMRIYEQESLAKIVSNPGLNPCLTKPSLVF